MGKKEEKSKKHQQFEEEQQYLGPGVRKAFNHVVQRKKKRVVSLVKMKPLKDRQKYYELPQFCPDGYSKEQFDRYRQEFTRVSELTRDDLREILKINKQDATPTRKQQLLHRCADGYALGRIPICPHCFGTNPIYDKNKGDYFCPGYKEGENFIKCQTYFDKEDLPRIKPWDNNFEERQRVRLERLQQKLKKQRQYQVYYKINKRDKLKKKNQDQHEQNQNDQNAENNNQNEDNQEQKNVSLKEEQEDSTKKETVSPDEIKVQQNRET